MRFPSLKSPFIQTYQETEIISPFFAIPLVNTNFGLLKYGLPTYSHLGLQYSGDSLYPLMLENESLEISKAIFDFVDKNQEFILSMLEPDIIKHKQKLETLILAIQKMDLENLTPSLIYNLYKRFQKTLTEYWGLVWICVAIDFPHTLFSDFIQKLLQQNNINQAQSVKLITLFQNVSSNDLLLGKYFKKLVEINQIDEKFDLNDLKDFEWIHWNYDNGQNLDQELVSLDFMEAKKWNFDDLEDQRTLALENIENTDIKFWLQTLSDLSRIKAQSKEMLAKTCFYSQGLIDGLSKAFKVDKNELKWLRPIEIDNLSKNNFVIPEMDIDLRKRQGIYIIQNEGISVYTNDIEIEKIIIKNPAEIAEKSPDHSLIYGQVACSGKTTGSVVIIRGTEEMKNKEFPKGSILISVNTSPNMLPIMRLASAIVTDVGGITSHASIVSRELGIPCIVGAKIATQVLHDGDKVEVDAFNGIIKLLKR